MPRISAEQWWPYQAQRPNWSGRRRADTTAYGYYWYWAGVNGTAANTQPSFWPTQASFWPPQFNAGDTITVTAQTAQVWQQWTGTSNNYTVVDTAQQWTEWRPQPLTAAAWTEWQEIPAQRARVRHQSERQKLVTRNRAHTAKLRERIAQRRARDLLLSQLDDVQAEQWRTERAFTIETADGARHYRIRHGVAGNIMLVKDGDREAPAGSWLRRFCFHAYHPDGSIPVEDHVLAQKLYIESNEEGFLRLANPA